MVSNLPYGAGTPILLGVLALPVPPEELTVMVQLEVAEKLLATPIDPEYGAPSIHVGLKATGRILRRFGPEVFWPQPKVRSALLHLCPRRPPPLAPQEHEPFAAFVTALFGFRRKMLGSSLALVDTTASRAGIERALGVAGVRAAQRPQELAPERMLELWRALDRPLSGS